ncbi:MAG: DUF6647 family protein [Paracoccaceae bacterium]
MTAIVAWLAMNFGLPVTEVYPEIQFLDRDKMIAVRAAPLNAEQTESLILYHENGPDLVALYDDHSRTIYLPENWSPTSPADVSVLVHEMVHHVQNIQGEMFICPEAREKPAYLAQSKWLEEAGLSLESEFELDRMTLHFLTNCWLGGT